MSDLDEVATRVLAPNPSPMTLDGTNTYLLGAPDATTVVVVDPGPRDPAHLARVEQVRARRGAEVAGIVVTHRHRDHAEAAVDWARHFGAVLFAADAAVSRPADAGPDHRGETLRDGQRLTLAGLSIEVVATPGHTRDHVALRLPTGALLTGDHVLGRGTSVIAEPDGNLEAYLVALRRVLDLGPDALLPGHGPELTRDPSAVVRFYLEHRRFREAQLLTALTAGASTLRELVRRIYSEVDPRLWDPAEASTRSTLTLLARQGRVRFERDGRVRLTDR